jgi:Ca2+-binding RTX toxin-like protein
MRPALAPAALVLLAPLLVLGAPAPTASGAADETCAGLPATIVGRPGTRDLEGTPGPDVIVTAGSAYVDAGDGDDLVCVTVGRAEVQAGAGEDEVRVLDDVFAAACLGLGSDTYVGGPGTDVVDDPELRCARDDDPKEGAADEAPDVIRTGAGNDFVWAGAGPVSADVVDLGPGDDEVRFGARTLAPEGLLAGGDGRDRLLLVPEEAPSSADWVLDNSDPGDGRATTDGDVAVRWSSFDGFAAEGEVGSYSFVGSRLDETLRARSVRSVDMRGGDDEAVLLSHDPHVEMLRGGPGDDRFTGLECGGRLVLDLARQRYSCGTRRGVVGGIEDLSLKGHHVTARGTAARDRLVVSACRGTVDLRRGRDAGALVRQLRGCPPPGTSLRLYGGEGDDLLRGTTRVVVDGGPGRDRCRGNLQRRCEVQR